MSKDQNITRKLKAILSADVKGYSLLMADDEVLTLKTLNEYRDIMSELINSYSGRVVDAVGDNLLAEFSSAVDAVNCAVKIQNRLKDENTKYAEHRKLQFRIGINIGDIIHDGDRIAGETVNIAARIESLTDAGGIGISRNTYDQVKNKLQVETKYLGEHQVKNIKEPVRVYKVLMGDDVYQPLVKEKLELPENPSIAVLPFTNMSGDPSQEYFSDGLTEQIINGLCKVSNLFVIARNSSFSYKGKAVPIKQIAKELGVKYILEGSVQKAGERVRITSQLIDAETDFHMFSENYDRDLSDIFALQDEITMKVIHAMEINLTFGEQARLWEGTTKNIQAYDKLMRGVECISHGNEKGNKQAQKYLEESIKIDKAYSLAYAILGTTHILDILFGWSTSPLESFGEADKYVQKSLALNDSLDLPHMLLGWIYLFKKQHNEAIKEGEMAIKLNPNGAEAHGGLAFILCYSDKADIAIKLVKQALRLDPIPRPHVYHFIMIAYRTIGQHENAIKWANKSLHNNPDQLSPNITLVASNIHLKRSAKVKNAVKEVMRINPNFSINHLAQTLPFKKQETLNIFINALRKAGLPD